MIFAMKLFFGEIFPEPTINDEEQQHISKVLRMNNGDEIFVTDGKGNSARGSIYFEGKKVRLNSIEIFENHPKFSTKLHIAIAPTKNIDRIEYFVEKATEMGISEITFLNTEKTERKNINLDKLTKQSIGASKQSLRFHFPKLNDLTKLPDFIKNINPETTFIAHCDRSFDRIEIQDIPNLDEVTFLIGPEGDFSPNEIKMLAERGVRAVSLGSQRLRTETAGIFVAAWNYYRMMKNKES